VEKLCNWNLISLNSHASFKDRVGSVFFTGLETLNDYFSHTEKFDRIKFNVNSIDEVLQGGIEVCAVTEIYGAAGCGKTQLCLHLAFNCRLPVEIGGNDGKVLYLTTDKPACARRLNQLNQAFRAKYGDIDFLGGILISQFNKAKDFEEFVNECVPKICKNNNIKLFIIDSIAGIFRVEHNYINRAVQLCNLFQKLESLASQFKFAILVTNHVTTVIDEIGNGEEKPSLGVTWTSLVTCRINVKKLEMTSSMIIDDHEEFSKVRKLKIDFSPRLPPKVTKFIITSRGIEEDNANNMS
jgi:RecA/RadA recombinase